MRRRLLGLLFCLFMLAMSREPPWADAHVVYETTAALVNHGDPAIQLNAAPYFFVMHNGKKYGIASIGNAIALIPSYLTYKALSAASFLPDRPIFALTSHLSSALLMAWAGVIFYGLCLRRGADRGMALLLALALCVTTICFCYARSPYSEALQTVALLLVVERTFAVGDKMTMRGAAGLGAAAGMLLASKLVYVTVLPGCILYLVYHHLYATRTRDLQRFVRGAAVALAVFTPFVALCCWHNWVKTGSPLHSGYRGVLFNGDLFAALYGFLLSTGKGMFFYSPPLVLGLLGLPTAWRRFRGETLLLLSIVGLVLLFSGKFRLWHGDYAWGPRYMVSLTPLIFLCALPWLPEALARGRRLLRRTAFATLLAVGLWVQFLGSALYWDHYLRIMISVKEQTGASGWSEDFIPHSYFVPQFSPLSGHFWLLGHMIRRDSDLDHDAPWKSLIPRRLNLASHWERVRPDWWLLDWVVPETPAPPKTLLSPARPAPSSSLHAVAAGLLLLSLFLSGAIASGAALYARLRRAQLRAGAFEKLGETR